MLKLKKQLNKRSIIETSIWFKSCIQIIKTENYKAEMTIRNLFSTGAQPGFHKAEKYHKNIKKGAVALTSHPLKYL